MCVCEVFYCGLEHTGPRSPPRCAPVEGRQGAQFIMSARNNSTLLISHFNFVGKQSLRCGRRGRSGDGKKRKDEGQQQNKARLKERKQNQS